MEFILSLIYLYLIIYTIYILVLALRNLKEKPFSIEKKYSRYDAEKRNFAVIIYSHNHREGLENLVEQFKMQEYPLANFKLYAVLDDCNDGSDKLFEHDRFVHVLNIHDTGRLGKHAAVSLLLKELEKEDTIDAYVFIDSTRSIDKEFLNYANNSLNSADAVTGEVNINREQLDIIDKIKAVYKKYQANFFKQARTLMGLATQIDSGLFIVKKSVVEETNGISFENINAELAYSLLLSQIGHKCTYNPNIQSYVLGQDCTFSKYKLTERLKIVKNNYKDLKTLNFPYIEHYCSLINPNFWLVLFAYMFLITYSYNYTFIVHCNVVLFSAFILAAAFGISLVNAKLTANETMLLLLHPIYSICHIIKNLPPVRYLLKKIGANGDKEIDKLVIDSMVMTKHGDRACKLEFISTESGLSKIRFIYKNKKYTTTSHLRMIDALQQLKSKMDDYGLVLKICSCCKNFTSSVDGTKNMLKGLCHNEFPSPLLTEPRPTLIWNTCSCFEPEPVNNFIEEMAKELEEQSE